MEYVEQKCLELDKWFADLEANGYKVTLKKRYMDSEHLLKARSTMRFLIEKQGDPSVKKEYDLDSLPMWDPFMQSNNGLDAGVCMCSRCRKLYHRYLFQEKYFVFQDTVYCLDCLLEVLQLEGLSYDYNIDYRIDGVPIGNERMNRRSFLCCSGEEKAPAVLQKVFAHFGVTEYKEDNDEQSDFDGTVDKRTGNKVFPGRNTACNSKVYAGSRQEI